MAGLNELLSAHPREATKVGTFSPPPPSTQTVVLMPLLASPLPRSTPALRISVASLSFPRPSFFCLPFFSPAHVSSQGTEQLPLLSPSPGNSPPGLPPGHSLLLSFWRNYQQGWRTAMPRQGNLACPVLLHPPPLFALLPSFPLHTSALSSSRRSLPGRFEGAAPSPSPWHWLNLRLPNCVLLPLGLSIPENLPHPIRPLAPTHLPTRVAYCSEANASSRRAPSSPALTLPPLLFASSGPQGSHCPLEGGGAAGTAGLRRKRIPPHGEAEEEHVAVVGWARNRGGAQGGGRGETREKVEGRAGQVKR